MSNADLDHFGKLLITNVRDASIDQWERVFDKNMRDERSKKLYERLSQFTPEQLQMLRNEMLNEIVDTVLHKVMGLMEERREILLGVRSTDGTVTELREIDDSPGLLMSLFDWIEAYSKKHWYQGG